MHENILMMEDSTLNFIETVTTEANHIEKNKLKKVNKIYKCPLCGEKYLSKKPMYTHMYAKHDEYFVKDMTPARLCYNIRNKCEVGKCRQCHTNPTKWNEFAERYDAFCGEPCKQAYVKMVKGRMIHKYGKEHLLNDPEKQTEMRNNRRISGVYTFLDKTELHYNSSYELDFLGLCDTMDGFNGKDIVQCEFVFEYMYQNKRHFAQPDYYLIPFNLIVEIKDGGDNPNTHWRMETDREKELLKDAAVIKSEKFNYIKIVNKEYSNFITILDIIRDTALIDPEFKSPKNLVYFVPE